MTRKRIVRPTAGTEADTELETGRQPESEAEQIDAELDGLAQQLPEGAIGSLYRFTEGAEKEFVDEMLVVDFSLTAVKQRYGSGRYILYLRTPDPNVAGKSFRQGSKRFRIAGVPITTPPGTAIAGTPGAASADERRLLSGYADMIQAQVKSQLQGAEMLQTMQMAVLRNLTERAPDPSIDLMKTLLPALISRGGGGSDLGQIITLADRLASKSGPAAGLKETLELLKAAREFAGGSSDDTPPWLGLASRGLETIGKLVETRAAAPAPLALAPGEPAPIAEPTLGAEPAPGAEPQPEGQTVPPNVHPLFSFLAPRMADLVTHASLDHDPTTYAGVLADLIPDAYADQVRAKITEARFVAELGTIFPAVVPFTFWFTELRDDLAERLAPEEPPTTAPTPEA